MFSLRQLTMRVIACALLALSLSACVNASQPSIPMYYQPALYSSSVSGMSSMEYYAMRR